MLGSDTEAVPVFDRVLAAQRRAADEDAREQALYDKGWAFTRMERVQDSADAFERLAHEFPEGRLAH